MKNLKKWLSMWVQALIVVAIAIAIVSIVYGITNYVSTNNTVKVAGRSILSMDKVVPSQDITELNRLWEKIKSNPSLDTTEEYRVSRFGIYWKTLQGSGVGSNTNLISLLRNIWFSCVSGTGDIIYYELMNSTRCTVTAEIAMAGVSTPVIPSTPGFVITGNSNIVFNDPDLANGNLDLSQNWVLLTYNVNSWSTVIESANGSITVENSAWGTVSGNGTSHVVVDWAIWNLQVAYNGSGSITATNGTGVILTETYYQTYEIDNTLVCVWVVWPLNNLDIVSPSTTSRELTFNVKMYDLVEPLDASRVINTSLNWNIEITSNNCTILTNWNTCKVKARLIKGTNGDGPVNGSIVVANLESNLSGTISGFSNPAIFLTNFYSDNPQDVIWNYLMTSISNYGPNGKFWGWYKAEAWYMEIYAANEFIQYPAFNIANNDFTIEMWFKTDSVANNTYLWNNFNLNNTAWYSLFYNWTSNRFSFGYYNWVYNGLNFPVSITAGQWNHIAFVRNGTQLKFYLNGVENGTVGTINGTILNNTNKRVYVGQNGTSARYFDEIRVSDYARYTTNFSIPTEEFTN